MTSTAIAALSAEDIDKEIERFPRVFSLTLKDKAIRWLSGAAVLALLLYSLNRFGFFSEKFYGSLGKLIVMVDQMFPPTTGGQFWDYVNAIGETLSMALIGSLIVGWLGASSYASTYMDCKCVEPIAGAQNLQGGMGYNSVLIVKAGSPYKKYEDLKGKTVARNDPHSTSGYLIPTVAWAKRGTPIDKYFNSPLSGGHVQTVMGVLKGVYDAGFTWTTLGDGFGNIRKMIDKGLLKRDQIRVIWTSALVPTPPVTILKSLPLAMKADLTKLFLRLEENDPKMAEAVAQGKSLGMQRVYHEDYLAVIEAKMWVKAQRKKKK